MSWSKRILEKSLGSKGLKAIERQSKKRGIDSFSLAVPEWLASKASTAKRALGKGGPLPKRPPNLTGKDAEKFEKKLERIKQLRSARGKAPVRDFTWKNISRPAMAADTAAGSAIHSTLGKIPKVGPGVQSLFTQKHWVDAGKGTKKLIERPSGLAPLSKAKTVAEPFVVAYGAEKGLSSLRDKMKDNKQKSVNQGMIQNRMQKKASNDLELREKVASVMLRLNEEVKGHEKRAHAEKILYRKIELGHELPPLSYSEWQEKIASLVNEDLCVLEKALDLSGSIEKNASFGDVAETDPQGDFGNANEKFLAALLYE